MRKLVYIAVSVITLTLGLVSAAIWRITWQTAPPKPQIQVTVIPSKTPSSMDIEAEKYAVYSALLRDMYVENDVKLLVIQQAECDIATPDQAPRFGADADQWTFNQMPSLQPDTIEQFNLEKRKCFPVTRQLTLPVKYVIVGSKELDQVFRKQGIVSGWNAFYRRYPQSSGTIDMSNVGFNAELDQALVYTGRMCGGLCGAGHFVLLSKDERGWKVAAKVMTWIS
ncbi:MAG TPA: hypothetical protein VKB46_21605 [Pyrinomonadaceae bacterium]|nr:hypothetical protein [Pyrinomonadaceae bacterium]